MLKYKFCIEQYQDNKLWFSTLKEAFDGFHDYFEKTKQDGDEFHYNPLININNIENYKINPDLMYIKLGFIINGSKGVHSIVELGFDENET